MSRITVIASVEYTFIAAQHDDDFDVGLSLQVAKLADKALAKAVLNRYTQADLRNLHRALLSTGSARCSLRLQVDTSMLSKVSK